MKLLVAIVYAIAVNVVLGQDFSNESEVKELRAKSQKRQNDLKELGLNSQLSSETINGTILVHHLEEKPSERRVGKTKCRRKFGGRCVRRRKRCPGHLPDQTSPGKRYCSKFHRCCYQAATDTCPDGFFNVPGGTQCFKLFTDSPRSWDVSNALCGAETLQMAKPDDPVALRKQILDTYGDNLLWLGAKVDDSGSVMWIRDGTTISNTNSAWEPGQPDGGLGYCLVLAADQWGYDQYPTQTYFLDRCDKEYDYYALCELVV